MNRETGLRRASPEVVESAGCATHSIAYAEDARASHLVGLDISHDCWQGTYPDFGKFREAVAAAAKEVHDYAPDYDGHPPRAFLGWWDNRFPVTEGGHRYTDALDVFFIHSDCEGWIFPQDAGPLADRLEPLVDHLDDDHRPSSHRQSLEQFIAGLREASVLYEVVEFR